MKNIKTILKFLLFLSIGILFIWLSLKNLTGEQKKEILNSFKIADYRWLLVAFVIGMLSHIARALRWRMLLEPLGYYPRLFNVLSAIMIGYFANLALPRLGEITRCGTLTKYEKISFTKSFGTVITERMLDFLVFVLLFFINLMIQYKKIGDYVYDKVYIPFISKYTNINFRQLLIIAIAGSVICLLIFFLFLRKRIIHSKLYIKIKEFILSFWHGIKSIGKIKHPVLFIVYTILIWAGYLMSTYVCFFCFESTSGFGVGAAFVILVFGSIGVMITPGGIGAYTFIVAGVLINIYNMKAVDANAYGWMVWASQTITVMVAGTICFLILTAVNKNYVPKTISNEILATEI